MMPIYEYYCETCDTLFSFLTSSPTSERPNCPACDRPRLPKRPSRFATPSPGEAEPPGLEGLAPSHLENVMSTLVTEMGDVDDSDPRRVGSFLRRFGELSGLEISPRLEDVLGRLEAGDGVERIESEMEALGEEQPLEDFFELKEAARRGRRRPKIDEELHFL